MDNMDNSDCKDYLIRAGRIQIMTQHPGLLDRLASAPTSTPGGAGVIIKSFETLISISSPSTLKQFILSFYVCHSDATAIVMTLHEEYTGDYMICQI